MQNLLPTPVQENSTFDRRYFSGGLPSGQGDLYTWAHTYYKSGWDLSSNEAPRGIQIDSQEKWLEWELGDFVLEYCNDDAFKKSLDLSAAGNYDFYKWSGLRYLQMTYEAEIQLNKTIQIDRILLGRHEGKTNDYYSIEHVWATNNRAATGQNDRPIDKSIKRRLGNYVLLEMGINIAAQDHDIEKKMEIYLNPDRPTDLQQVRYLVKNAEAVIENLSGSRLTRRRYYQLYRQICNNQEDRYVEFALKRWSVADFIHSDSDESDE